MQEAALRSAAIIQDLLALSRRSTCCVEPVALKNVMTSYLASASHRELENRFPNITLKTKSADDAYLVQGSMTHLTQIIMNLVMNAYEVISDSGTVTIRCHHVSVQQTYNGFEPIPVGDYCLLAVGDTGPGINPEDITHIFEPFFSKKKMGRSGTGLGLAVVYGVVKDMQGYIDISSREGIGSEFCIYLPSSSADVDVIQEEKIKDATGNGNILVVDDDASQRDIACRLLEHLGYRVDAVSGRSEALAYVKNHPVDLVIMDMILSEHYDGLDVYRDIHAIYPEIKCVIVSGFSAGKRIQEAQALGAAAFVQKPYTTKVIGKAVRDALE